MMSLFSVFFFWRLPLFEFNHFLQSLTHRIVSIEGTGRNKCHHFLEVIRDRWTMQNLEMLLHVKSACRKNSSPRILQSVTFLLSDGQNRIWNLKSWRSIIPPSIKKEKLHQLYWIWISTISEIIMRTLSILLHSSSFVYTLGWMKISLNI